MNSSSINKSRIRQQVRRRGFQCLGLMGMVVIMINIYVFGIISGGGDTVRSPLVLPQPRPIIPGLSQPQHLKRNPSITSKDGSSSMAFGPKQPFLSKSSQSQQPPYNHHKDNNQFVPTVNDGKEKVVQILSEATIQVNATMRANLPTWEQITQLLGEHPVLYHAQEDSCSRFRASVEPVERMLGAAGMFSTGTNLITTLLKNNCQIPERVTRYGLDATREEWGMRWQVPWGKHTPAHYKTGHAAQHAQAINKDAILPVVTIRNPYQWMASMCKNPYSARWKRANHCPNLKIWAKENDGNMNNTVEGEGEWNPVTVKYGAGFETYQSLAHLFNDWYHDYTRNASYPWIMIRMEDLIFHTKETVTAVCECAGGQIRTDRLFVYTVDSAKADSPGHDTSVGYYQAWIRYSQPARARGGFSSRDYVAAKEVLDEDLMRIFGYSHPPAV